MSSTDIEASSPAGCCSETTEIVQEQLTDTTDTITEIDFLLDKENQSQTRLDICRGCDQLLPIVNLCKQCGCQMNIKTRLFASKCPLNKW